MTLRTRRPGHDGNSLSSADSTYGSASEASPSATHDISRVKYHVKHLDSFAQALQDSASRAFPNRGRSFQRYSKVQALMLHWKSDDLFVLPELEDLEKCLREDYLFETDIFAIPSENAHLELMLKVADLVKKHESDDTLFLVYYGGHARIDESRQSTWCATRHPNSPWLQWSAIQTLLERSMSDVLILLDCCAGAASATFPTGKSITETISASSWDAIAPDPGRYSFTNALIEVLQEWRVKTFSAAMLHAEVLARLKHPRPILINGKHFEARSTPVHFMMTSNHRAPSIEIGRIVPEARLPPTPPKELPYHGRHISQPELAQDVPIPQDALVPCTTEPNENQPHVMISLALEDDQRLDINAWEQWLGSFPALAKYVKVQGVFKSHSTLLLLSLPVMVWDLLPDDPACAFIAFIRSNNLIRPEEAGSTPTQATPAVSTEEVVRGDTESFMSGTTYSPADDASTIGHGVTPSRPRLNRNPSFLDETDSWASSRPSGSGSTRKVYNRKGSFTPTGPSPGPAVHSSPSSFALPPLNLGSSPSQSLFQRQQNPLPPLPGVNDNDAPLSETISRTMVNTSHSSRKTPFNPNANSPEGLPLSKHVVKRLEHYFQQEQEPSAAWMEFLASNLGVETSDIHLWYHHRREQERMTYNLQSLRLGDAEPGVKEGARMILPGHLNNLLEIYPSKNVLIVDLRSATDFEKSHIHDAVNLRAPLSFVQNTSLEMIEDTLVDDQSRRSFSKWSQYRCVVFYDRVVEFDWECPVADALFEQFRRKGWMGQCFILKGHYREFSASFDKYISGSKMSKVAKEYLDGLRQQSSLTQEEADRRHQQYDEWLMTFVHEDRVPQRGELIPSKKLERRHALEQHQKELETEFESRFPALYRKAQAMRQRPASPPPPPRSPSPPPPFERRFENEPFREVNWNKGEGYQEEDNYDRKAPLVGPLVSGLERIRDAGYGDHHHAPAPASAETYSYPAHKLDVYSPDDYDEIDPKSEGLRNDPAFQRAGAKLQDHAGSGGSSAADDMPNKKGGRGAGAKRPALWERLRTGR